MPMKCKNRLKWIALQWRLRNHLVVSSINAIWVGLMAEENALKPNHCLHKRTCIKYICLVIWNETSRFNAIKSDAPNKGKNSWRKQSDRGEAKRTRVGKGRMKKKNEDRRRIISKEYPSKIKAAQICKPNQTKNEKKMIIFDICYTSSPKSSFISAGIKTTSKSEPERDS